MKNSFDNYAKEGLHEECGVFGIFSDGTINPAYACYNGLLALQHRGQESCGIAVTDDGVIDYHKDMGLVTEVLITVFLTLCKVRWVLLMSVIRLPVALCLKIHNLSLCVMSRVRLPLLTTATLPTPSKFAVSLNRQVLFSDHY